MTFKEILEEFVKASNSIVNSNHIDRIKTELHIDLMRATMYQLLLALQNERLK